MRKIILLLLLDVAISCAVAGRLYFTRGVDAAFMTGLSIFVAFSPILDTLKILADMFGVYDETDNFTLAA